MPLFLTWPSFHASYVLPGIECVYRTDAAAHAPMLFVDADASRIGIWLPCKGTNAPLPKRSRLLELSYVRTQGIDAIEVATRASYCFEAFYSLASAIITGCDAGREPSNAAATAIASWRQLLRESAVLSTEGEIGLWGELWFLRWLQSQHPSDALSAWTGPLGDPHDFRFADLELEVKTSTSARRTHTISSLEQLSASAGHRLALLSILIAPTSEDSGETVVDLAASVRRALPPSLHSRFDELLVERLVPAAEDSAPPLTRYVLRQAPFIIPVDGDAPSLTRSDLARYMTPNRAARIHSATYRIALDGLGAPLSPDSLKLTH